MMIFRVKQIASAWITFLLLCGPASASLETAEIKEIIARGEAVLNAPASLYIDCQLRYAIVGCPEIVQGYFSAYATTIRRANHSSDALISLTMTDEALPNGDVVVHFSFASQESFSIAEIAGISVRLKPGMDEIAATNEIIQVIERVVLLHFKLVSVEDGENGQLISVYEPPTGSTPPRPNKFQTGPFFIDLSLSGNSSKQGLGSSNAELGSSNQYAGGNFLVNYSRPKFRALVEGHGDYSSTSYPGTTGKIEASNFSRGFDLTALYSIKKRWNVAVMQSHFVNPGSNIENTNKYSAGVEWTLVPFRVNENKEFRVQLQGGKTDIELLEPNARGNISENLSYAVASLRFYWLFLESKASIDASAKAKTMIHLKGYETYSAGIELGYQILKPLRVDGGVDYTYTGKSLTYPGDPDFSNPAQTAFLSGQPGGNLSFHFSIGATLGNGLLKSRDRRGQ